jgi:hypothetical protein
MGEFLPDYLLREQTAVGALIAFGLIRIIGAVIGHELSIRRGALNRLFLLAVVMYCMPQLFDIIGGSYLARAAGPELEGKLLGCAIAWFGAPLLSHKLGFE